MYPRRGNTSTAAPQRSLSGTGGGIQSTPPGAAIEEGAVEVDGGKVVPVLKPALVYDMKREVCALPTDNIKVRGTILGVRVRPTKSTRVRVRARVQHSCTYPKFL